MKYTIKKKQQEKSNIKIAFELLSLVFVMTTFTLLMIFSNFQERKENDNEEYVEVFKETDFYDFLGFEEIEKQEKYIEGEK